MVIGSFRPSPAFPSPGNSPPHCLLPFLLLFPLLLFRLLHTLISSSCFVMGRLSYLNFKTGLEFQSYVCDRFGSSVSPILTSPGFVMVVSFSRSSLRLNVDSISFVLQSCLGGLKIFEFLGSKIGASVLWFHPKQRRFWFIISRTWRATLSTFVLRFGAMAAVTG